MISFRNIQKLLAQHFDANEWKWSCTWKSPPEPTVLTEYWTVNSRWSPTELAIYIGFENWDDYESVGLSTSPPVPGEKNDWIETINLLKNWQREFDSFLNLIERLRDNADAGEVDTDRNIRLDQKAPRDSHRMNRLGGMLSSA